MKKQFSDYVCPYCFHQLQNCTCDSSAWNLIQIDEGVQEIVRMCNEKGWFTSGCCEGHYIDDGKIAYIDIQFQPCYSPSFFPKDWTIKQHKSGCLNGQTLIAHAIEYNNLSEFDTNKSKLIKELTDWAKSLPINTNA